ncbi:MAG TPA: FtsX-like permease family protein [Solirubrobacteraceae bacterium]|nr:FtsX-like permease family protein [Solirubrobacteraceae bacterium]
MKLRNVPLVLEGHIRSRSVLLQMAFAVFGISVGVALLFGSQIASTTLTHSAAQLNTTQLVGAAQVQLDSTGPEGFPQALLAEVRRQPGVLNTLPVIERQATITGRSGEQSVDLIGVEPSSLTATVPALREFSAKLLNKVHGVALPEPIDKEIHAGITVRLQVNGQVAPALVGAIFTRADIGSLIESPVALTSINYAQKVSHTAGRLTRIFVRYRPADERTTRRALQALASRAHVALHPADFDKTLFGVAVKPESESELLFSGISALVGFMFALNAMLVTIPARRKLIADLREDGGDFKAILQVLLADALLIGVPASILGLLAGDALSRLLFDTEPGYLAFAFPVGNARVVTLRSGVLAAGAGVLAAVVGVLWPVRQILGRRLRAPHQWTLTRTTRTALFAIGVVSLALTTIILIADTGAAVLGNATLILGLVAWLPLLFDLALRAFDFTLRFVGGPSADGALDELNAPQTRVRSLAIAALAAVAVLGVVEFQGVATNLQHGLDASARDLDTNADVWITPRGGASLLSTVSFQSLDTAALSRVPGVASVGAYRGSFLDWGQRRLWVIGPDRDSRHLAPPSQLLSGDARLATARLRQGGWVLLSRALADEHHLGVGQSFRLPSPRPLTVRLAGVTTNLGWPPGAVILSAAEYLNGWEDSSPSAYEIQTISRSDQAAVRARVAALLAGHPALAVETAGQRAQRHYALAAQGLERLTQIRHLVVISAILALIAAMLSLLWQRRDRIAFSRSNGISSRVLWGSLVIESTVLLLAGSLFGAIWGLYAQLLGSHFLSAVTGFPIVFNIEAVAAIAGFALVSPVAVAVLAVPGYFAASVRARSVSPAY